MQPDLFSDPLPADLSRVGPRGETLYIAPSNDLVSRHCSAMGALKAQPNKEAQHQRMLAMYRQHGGLTDAEMEALTGIDRSSVTPRRTELIKLGLVESDPAGTRKNPQSAVSNKLWRLKGSE